MPQQDKNAEFDAQWNATGKQVVVPARGGNNDKFKLELNTVYDRIAILREPSGKTPARSQGCEQPLSTGNDSGDAETEVLTRGARVQDRSGAPDCVPTRFGSVHTGRQRAASPLCTPGPAGARGAPPSSCGARPRARWCPPHTTAVIHRSERAPPVHA